MWYSFFFSFGHSMTVSTLYSLFLHRFDKMPFHKFRFFFSLFSLFLPFNLKNKRKTKWLSIMHRIHCTILNFSFFYEKRILSLFTFRQQQESGIHLLFDLNFYVNVGQEKICSRVHRHHTVNSFVTIVDHQLHVYFIYFFLSVGLVEWDLFCSVLY